jgi:prevent-host-death family protein
MTDPVNVAEAKAKFSHLLDRAAGGEEIVISRSGKPIARLAGRTRETAKASIWNRQALENPH